jgi:hypothetical protein
LTGFIRWALFFASHVAARTGLAPPFVTCGGFGRSIGFAPFDGFHLEAFLAVV